MERTPTDRCIGDAVENAHDGLQVVAGFVSSLLGYQGYLGLLLAPIVGFTGLIGVGLAVTIDLLNCLANRPTFL